MAGAQRLYDWEREVVEPRAVAFLSREQCLSLVSLASAAAGIPAPSVRFAKSSSAPCRAEPAKWRITVADWGRTPVTVLHEVAHLATLDAVLAGEDPHGPAFLGQAMRFYEGFLGVDRALMERTAAAAGLSFSRSGQAGRREAAPRRSAEPFPEF